MITISSLEEKEFKITTKLLTKKYNKNLNSGDFNEITSDFIDSNNKKLFIDDKPIEPYECYDFNIYQIIQTRIKEKYFLPNIELNDLFEFDYNKIFYFLNKNNICTIDKSASNIIREIEDKSDVVKYLYNKKVFVLDFDKLDYENPLKICKEIIYYNECRIFLDTNKIMNYLRYERVKVEKAKDLFYKAYKNRYETARLKKESYENQKIPDENAEPFKIDDIKADLLASRVNLNIDDIKINPLTLNLSVYENIKDEINGNKVEYDSFLVYNGEKFKMVDDIETRENNEITMYELIDIILNNEDLDIYNINKTRDYDILYFIYLQFINYYHIITEYFKLTDQIINDIKTLILNKENYNFSLFQSNDGLEILKKNFYDYMNLFYNHIIKDGGKRTKDSRLLLENNKINIEYKNNISNIKIYNKITNIYNDVDIKDIFLNQNFYFTLFFQDTITKPLNIDYINPIGYHKNLNEQVDLNDEYFYKPYHQVYLLSSFHNSTIFNEMKKDLLYLNFKIDFKNNKIIFLNQDEKEEYMDEYFYFYQDNINIENVDNVKIGLIKSEYNNKLYVLGDIYDKLIQYHEKIYNNANIKYKNKEYKSYFNDYKEKFLLVYSDKLFDRKKLEEHQLLKNILSLITKDQTTGIISVSDKVKEFNKYNTSQDDKDKINFETKLKDLYVSGLKLLNFYYDTLTNEEQFNKNLEEKIIEYKKKYEQETENQALEYKIDEIREINDGYGYYYEGTEEQRETFSQIIKTFIYILFDLLINRIFINQKFTYSEFIKKISDVYFGVFNLMFFKSDKKKINQYKKLLEYYLSYYQIKKINGNDEIKNYNDEKFKTLKDLNDKSDIIIDALISSFIFLISEKYLTYGIDNESIKAIKIITDAYIYYCSLYEQNVIINGQTININDGNKDIYYEYQELITKREKITQEIKDLFKELNDNPDETIKKQIQDKIIIYNKIKDQIIEKENELLNPDIIKQKESKGDKKIIHKDNKEFKEEIKEKYINPFINLINQMLENDKITKDEKIKKLLNDKKKYFDDLINNNNINSQIFKDSLNSFYNYKNLRINQHLTNKEVIQYGINESLTSSLIDLIKSQQIKKGDYFLISKNKKVKDAYIYLLNDYEGGENEFKIKINNINEFVDLLDTNIEKNKENYDIYKFVVDNQNNTGPLKTKLNELTNNGFKNNQLSGKYKLLQKQ